MSINAQYAATPLIQSGTTTTADTSYTAPTNATVGVIVTAGSTGARIDNLDSITQGTSVAGLLRLWVCQGTMGSAISSITSATTTATVTTATAHNLITGDLVTIQGAYPVEYNKNSVAITVTSTTAFTYTITSVSNVAASAVGFYSSTRAAATYSLLQEVTIPANTGSTTVPANATSFSSIANPEFMPVILPAGYSLRTTVSVTQTGGIITTARGGSF